VLKTMAGLQRLRRAQPGERHLVYITINTFHVRVTVMQCVVLQTPQHRRSTQKVS
jgi:hypothetical protein